MAQIDTSVPGALTRSPVTLAGSPWFLLSAALRFADQYRPNFDMERAVIITIKYCVV